MRKNRVEMMRMRREVEKWRRGRFEKVTMTMEVKEGEEENGGGKR